MPRLSDSMEEGTVLKWLKADGEEVHRGDELVEIETDKATMTYEADLDGVLQIVAAEGSTLPIGTVIAYVGGENGKAAASTTGQGEATVTAPPTAASATGVAAEAAATTAPGAGAQVAPVPDGERVRASPLARRIARELGVELRGLQGSGPGGRVVRADVEGAAASGSGAAPAAAPAPVAPPAPAPAPVAATPAPVVAAGDVATAKGEVRVQELTRTQQVVARRMAESKATIPDFTLNAEVDMEGAVALRRQLKELGGPVVPTYNDMVVKACAIALREHPRANGSYRDGHFELYSRVNVGVAVAAQDALVVPTVFDADAKSLTAIAAETQALAARVRDGVVTPPELSGGTFTVSNLGMFGVTSFTAVINPPQAAILSVGLLAERAVVRDGALVARYTMPVTLACDHRILYGADAARFLARVRELLERPIALGF